METEQIFNDSGDDENQMEHENMSDEDDGGGNRDDEAQEVPATGEQDKQVIKPKRVVKNPMPKLDAIRLMGPRGVGILQSSMKELKFKGKGHEKDDLNMLMKRLEHWAHRLFPKLPFDDTLKQIEKLGTRRPVQNMVTRIRLDMFQSDEFKETSNRDAEEQITLKAPEIDVFDELLGTGPFAESGQKEPPEEISLTPIPTPSSKPMTLTEEQRERMERNRKLALERRNARLLELQNEKSKAIIDNNSAQSLDMDSSLNSQPASQSLSNSQHRPLLTFDDIRNEESSVTAKCEKPIDPVTARNAACSSRQTSSEANEAPISDGGKTEEMPIQSTENSPEGTSSGGRRDGADLDPPEDVKGNTNSEPGKDIYTEDDILGFINET